MTCFCVFEDFVTPSLFPYTHPSTGLHLVAKKKVIPTSAPLSFRFPGVHSVSVGFSPRDFLLFYFTFPNHLGRSSE